MPRQLIGIFGGTFDPIHVGHLRSALELRDCLQLDHLLLVPCHVPPHRDCPAVTAEHRLAMVRLAIAGHEGLECDDIELQRDTPSYTLDTLHDLRRRYGRDAAFCLIIGTDACNGLHTWHGWQALFEEAHLLVIQRPGHDLHPDEKVLDWVAGRRIKPEALRRAPAGGFLEMRLRPWPVSATRVRERLSRGEDVSELLPAAVAGYIYQHKLYGYAPE